MSVFFSGNTLKLRENTTKHNREKRHPYTVNGCHNSEVTFGQTERTDKHHKTLAHVQTQPPTTLLGIH